MATIRLLTSVQGGVNEPVVGDVGAVLDVPESVADVWADGVRAERVDLVAVTSTVPVASVALPSTPPPLVDLVKRVAVAASGPTGTPSPEPRTQPGKRTRQRRTRPVSS